MTFYQERRTQYNAVEFTDNSSEVASLLISRGYTDVAVHHADLQLPWITAKKPDDTEITVRPGWVLLERWDYHWGWRGNESWQASGDLILMDPAEFHTAYEPVADSSLGRQDA